MKKEERENFWSDLGELVGKRTISCVAVTDPQLEDPQRM